MIYLITFFLNSVLENKRGTFMIFNTHTHLNDSQVADVKSKIKFAHEMQVTHMAVVGSDIKTSLKAVEIALLDSNLYAICGLHPSDTDNFNDDFEAFKIMWNLDQVVGIGEIGLDYHFENTNKEKQLYYFEKFLQMSCEYHKPVIIHCRDAYQDTYTLLEKYYQQLDGIILHCYSGSVEMMQRFLKLGCYISIAGTVTFKNAKEIKEVAKLVPLDRLLVETDDPYLTPAPYRGQVNQPAYVHYVVQEIALLRNIPFDDIAKITFENAKKVFHL